MKDSFLSSTEWGHFIGLDNILLPIRGFPLEGDAITLAFYLAECAHAQIHIVHVKETDEEPELIKDLLKSIGESSAELKVKGNVEIIDQGNPAEVILKKEKDLNIDLIVLGTSRLKTSKELFGSQSSQIVKKAKSPVLLVCSPFEEWTAYRELKLKRILIPYRGIEADIGSIKLAAAMAKSSTFPDIEIMLVHVVQIPWLAPLAISDTTPVRKEEKTFLHNVGEFSHLIALPIFPRILIGRNFTKAIVGLTRRENFDLCIVGAKSRPKFWGLIRSDVSYIAKHAYCTTAIVFP